MSRPLRETAQEAVVLATTRRADREDALTVVRTGRDLVVNVADETLARLPSAAPGTHNSRCRVPPPTRRRSVETRGRTRRSNARGRHTDACRQRPLLSEADLRTASRLQVRVTTSPHTPRTTTRQKIATSIAMISGLLALILASGIGQGSIGAGIRHTWVRLTRPQASRTSSSSVRSSPGGSLLLRTSTTGGRSHARAHSQRPTSSPTTTNRSESASRSATGSNGFSIGLADDVSPRASPHSHTGRLGCDMDRLQVGIFGSLARRSWQREVARPTLGDDVRISGDGHGLGHDAACRAMDCVARRSLDGVLHQVPSAAECRATRAVRSDRSTFALRPSCGIVAVAPLFVVAPSLFRWARSHLPAGVAIVVASGALLLALAFVGSDIELRARSAQTLNAASTTVTDWRDEIVRYDVLVQARDDQISGNAAPLRRAAVALMLLAALAVVLRRRRDRITASDIPGFALCVALLLFIATPSKWPWHFGVLLSLVAVATAVATARICREQELGARTRTALPCLVIGALVLAVGWTWEPRSAWNAVDLRTYEWTLGWESTVSLTTLAMSIPIVILVCAVVAARVRRRSTARELWRVASWSASVLVVPVAAFTAATLLADTAGSPSWTSARANVHALTGERECGLAEDLQVVSSGSVRLLPAMDKGDTQDPDWAPPAPAPGLRWYSLAPTASSRSETPWFRVPTSTSELGFYLSGATQAFEDVALEWGEKHRGSTRVIARDPIDAARVAEMGASLPWRLITLGDLAVDSPRSQLARLAFTRDSPPAVALATTGLASYRTTTLASQLRDPRIRTLALFNVATFFPCVALPRLAGGIAEPPATIITSRDSVSPVRYPLSSPFAGVMDLFDLSRMSLGNSANPPENIVVFSVDPEIPGWRHLPASRTDADS